MNSTVTIRAATRSDLPEVVALWQEHQEFHAQCDPYFERSSNPNPGFLNFLQEDLDNLGLFVAQVETRIVGFILGEITSRPPCFASIEYGIINDLAVTAEWRRKGIGKLLVEKGMNWFTEKGIHRIEARVLMSNSLASNFWHKAGFDPYMETVYKVV